MTVSDTQAVDLLTQMLRVESLCGQEDQLANLLLRWMKDNGFEAWRDEVGNVIGTLEPLTPQPPSPEPDTEGPAYKGRGGLRGTGPDGPVASRAANLTPNLPSPSRGEGPGVRGPGGEGIVILGHMDTVPGVIPVQERDGSLYGRGAVDAKGPLATALVAAARASSRVRVRVIGAVQEEGPSAGARHLTTYPAPDYLIIAEPSGWDAVVLGYKGSQRFTVQLSQPCSHTAGPEPTAPERIVAFWNELVGWCDRAVGEGPSALPPRLRSTGAGALRAGHTPSQPVGDRDSKGSFTQLTPTLIALASESDGLRDVASMQIGLRLPPGLTPEAVQEGVRQLLPGGQFDFGQGEPAVRGEKSGPLVASFLRAIRCEGGTPRFKLKTGTSDMNVVGPVWKCPMLAYGPGDSRLDHTPEERLGIDEYLRAIHVLTHVLEEL